MKRASNESPNVSEGRLLLFLTGCLYGLFSLIPDSHSIMVVWSFVFLWQVGLLLPVFCLLWWLWQGKLSWLGNGLDWIVGLVVVGLFISTIFAPTSILVQLDGNLFSGCTVCTQFLV